MANHMIRPTLRLIEGGGEKSPSLLVVPSAVIGRSPFDRERLAGFRIATLDVRKALASNRRQPALNLWSCVIGIAPPQAGTAALPSGAALLGFASATACFRGVLRPVAMDDNGYDVFAYVHKPTHSYQYVPSMSQCIVPLKVPVDVVFVTYMKLDYPEGRPYGKDAFSKTPVQGIVTHWDFVESDPTDSTLPVNFGGRFRQRMW
jgi:hypothetical protein